MHTQQYIDHLSSEAWQLIRAQVIERCNGRCEDCGKQERLDVHHKTYDRLGFEHLDDLQGLCRACHERADWKRASEVAEERAIDTYLSKKYGNDWGDYNADNRIEEAERWLDRKRGW